MREGEREIDKEKERNEKGIKDEGEIPRQVGMQAGKLEAMMPRRQECKQVCWEAVKLV